MQTAEKQAEILKDQGNLYFKKERLAAAIEAYTEVFDPFLDFFSFLSVRDLLMVMLFSSLLFFSFFFSVRDMLKMMVIFCSHFSFASGISIVIFSSLHFFLITFLSQHFVHDTSILSCWCIQIILFQSCFYFYICMPCSVSSHMQRLQKLYIPLFF